MEGVGFDIVQDGPQLHLALVRRLSYVREAVVCDAGILGNLDNLNEERSNDCQVHQVDEAE